MNFDTSRYTELKDTFEAWWRHELKRPIIQVSLDKDTPKGGDYFATNYRRDILNAMYDFDIAPEKLAEIVDKAYDGVEYLGDAIPVFYMRPTGVLGGMLGEGYKINHEQGTIWFEQMVDDISEIKGIRFDEKNPLVQRALSLTKAVQDRFDGNIAIGIPDFGGVMDIAAAIRDSCSFCMDLISEEDEAMAACENIHEQFNKAYELFVKCIDKDRIPGYSCWATMLSQEMYFVLQNDFSAMIGSEMYDDFYLPVLKEECRMIPRTFYHLDGPDAVRHLDSILTVEELNGVQWVNGAGSAPLDHWDEIYKKVIGAGKLLQVFITGKEELKYIDYIAETVGTTEGLCFICTGKTDEEDYYKEYLRKYGLRDD